MIIDRPVKYTKHFKERLREIQMRPGRLLYILPLATEERPPDMSAKKYQDNDDIFWLRFETLIFTAKRVHDRVENQDIYLLLSVYDQRLDLNNPQFV